MLSSSSSEPYSTLSFFSLPAKSPPPDPPGMLTPPLHTSASVPFRWEEAPGKPRSCNDAVHDKKSTSARRCLELPPRLSVPDHHHPHQRRHARITNMPSPTTVLDGPDVVGRSLSYRVSFRSFRSPESLVKSGFGSSRWGGGGSFRKVDNIEVSNEFGSKVESVDNYKVMNKSKVRRRRSLLTVSSSKSHLWGSIYESLKQAVPWKRIRNKMAKQ